MKRITFIISSLIVLSLLSSCNLPGKSDSSVDIIDTQVAKLLTEAAVEDEQEATVTLAPSLTLTESIGETTPTQTPTITESPTLIPEISDPASQLGSADWTQDFSGSSSVWDFDYDQATFDTSDGYLTMTAQTNANWHSWYVSSPKLKNAYVETTIEMSNGSGLDRFGLAVRASSDGQQFYFLVITANGQWGFYRMASDVTLHEIQAYQTADQLSDIVGNPHRVGIWMEGSSFTFYIDGEEVGTASDDTLTSAGYTGFLIVYVNTNGFTVKVDQLQYWNVP